MSRASVSVASSPSSDRAAESRAGSRPTSTAWPPAATTRLAVARPMPELPPVTSTRASANGDAGAAVPTTLAQRFHGCRRVVT